MTTFSQENTFVRGLDRATLAQLFGPVSADLIAVEECLVETLGQTRDTAVRQTVDFLQGAPGKRIRPALVILSARAVSPVASGSLGLQRTARVNAAAAMELVHIASLVHDDFIDAAAVRHHRCSVNARWGGRVSVALGDYLCSLALRLLVDCQIPGLLSLLGSGLEAMCEGELLQVLGRGGPGSSEQDCLAVTEKKTGALFGASCGIGATVAGAEPEVCRALHDFGLHTGIAFQVLDDCRDLLSDQAKLGKQPGQDLLAGDVTLPVLCLLGHCRETGLEWTKTWGQAVEDEELTRIRELFYVSGGGEHIRQVAESHLDQARRQLEFVPGSDFAETLGQFADGIAATLFDTLGR